MNLSVTEAAPLAAEPVMRRPSLVGRTRAGLAEALAEIGVPEKEWRMRVGQLWNWIYHYGVRDFREMTTIGKSLRAQLAEHFSLDLPEVTAEQLSSDGTRKWLLRMAPTGPRDRGAEIECVYIPGPDRGFAVGATRIELRRLPSVRLVIDHHWAPTWQAALPRPRR